MDGFKEIPVESLKINPFSMIHRETMLLTAGNRQKCNTMTAGWGTLGVLWNHDVSTVYVRPSRYTLEFLDREPYYTLCFFGGGQRAALSYCGTHSGRDGDKIRAAGLTPVFDEAAPYFKEARLVLVCRKLYRQALAPACFLDKSIDGASYPKKDYHIAFVGSIEKVLQAAA